MAKVEVLSSELVVPAEDTPRTEIWMSNLDVVARRAFTSVLFFYRSNGGVAGFFSAGALKASLAAALVRYYPMAGRLGFDADGRTCLRCTGEGVRFVTARSEEHSLEEFLDDYTPSQEMRDLFLPPSPSPDPPCLLLVIQVTHMKCGGVVVGTNMHHSVVDATGASQFIEAWACISRGSTELPPPPFFDRTLLRARSPPVVSYIHPEYNPDAVAVKTPTTPTAYESANIPLSKSQVDALTARCAVAGERASVFRAIVALVWKCTCLARRLPPDEQTQVVVPVDMRPRVKPPLPAGFFGNAIVRTSAWATAGEVASGTIADAARILRGATNHGGDYARSLIDYLETVDLKSEPPALSSRGSLRAVSWLSLAFQALDFGWGAPAFVGRALMYVNGDIYVMKSAGTDGGVTIALSLEPEAMPAFKKMLFAELEGIPHSLQIS